MFQSIKNNLFYHPLFLIFINPISAILFGTLYALQFTKIHWLNFFFFYLFILATQFIETILSNYVKKQQPIRLFPLILFELLAIILSIYFIFQLNYLVFLLMIAYLFAIHFQFSPYNLTETLYGLILNSFFKGGIITYLSYFIQAKFISQNLYYWSISLILLALLVSFTKDVVLSNKTPEVNKQNHLIFIAILTLLYLSNLVIFFIFKTTYPYLWLQLLTLPIALRLIVIMKPNRAKYSTSIKFKTLLLFQLTYILIASLTILLK